MKITPAQQESFLKAPDRAIKAILFYGPDEGQSRAHCLKLIKFYCGAVYDPINIAEIDGASLSEDPARLGDELSSFSLMGGDRVVWLRNASSDAATVVESALLGEPAPVWPLLITSGDLRPTSKLRKLFEKHSSLAAVACYRDESRKLTQILSEAFREKNITCEQGVIQMLAGNLGNDRGVTLQEVEKIDCYLGEERHLTMDLAMLLSGDNHEQTLDELFNSVCGGEVRKLEKRLNRAFHENIQPIAIYRMLSSHLQKLLSVKAMLAKGMAQKSAFMKHGIFFKQEPLIQKQLPLWNPESLKRAIFAVLEAEADTKAGQLPPEMICRNLMHKLARYSSRSVKL